LQLTVTTVEIKYLEPCQKVFKNCQRNIKCFSSSTWRGGEVWHTGELCGCAVRFYKNQDNAKSSTYPLFGVVIMSFSKSKAIKFKLIYKLPWPGMIFNS